MHQRRKHVRTRVLKGAKLILGSSSVVDCTVRDLSAEGAGFQIPTTTGLPDSVDLTFDGGRTLRAGKLAWRLWDRAGIKFDSRLASLQERLKG